MYAGLRRKMWQEETRLGRCPSAMILRGVLHSGVGASAAVKGTLYILCAIANLAWSAVEEDFRDGNGAQI